MHAFYASILMSFDTHTCMYTCIHMCTYIQNTYVICIHIYVYMHIYKMCLLSTLIKL